jgi:RNA polymerase sigma factor (sigma-70 family)
MANAAMNGIVRDLCRLVSQSNERLSDHELLQGFAAGNDQAAFAALVRRHGAMVLRVCLNVLGQVQDAEDAFQATFLVLARKGASIRKRTSLASWLHGVAYRTAISARRDAGRRRIHEQEVVPSQPRDPAEEVTWREVQAILNEEIQRLPEKLRSPFVLCVLEGKRATQVARELGLKEGTVWSRLAQARQRLRERLAQQGLSLPPVLAAAWASRPDVSAHVRPSLVHSTVKAVLAEEVSQSMIATKVKLGIICLLMTGMLALGAGLLTRGEAGTQTPEVKAQEPPRPAPGVKEQPVLIETKEAITLNGRVVDADDKPIAGAEIVLGWWQPFARDWFPWVVTPFQPKPGVTTDADGRFRLHTTKADLLSVVDYPRNKPWRYLQVVASARGYGPGFVTMEPGQKELKITLPRKEAPLHGRVLDLQGRPVAGASVSVDHLLAGKQGQRILFVNSWPGLPDKVTTDREGRFTLPDVGRDREVLLHIQGPQIEHKLVTVRTAARERKVEVIAGPTKPIRGVIRDRDTGKPLAGVVVYGNREAHRGGIRAVTDAQGRYELVGLPKAKSYELSIFPAPAQPYLEVVRKVADSEGLKPLRMDVRLRRGIRVHLRVIDKITRKPVRGAVRYSPLADNPFHSEDPRPASNWASDELYMPDKDHCYNFVAYPGPGIIYAWVGWGPYLPASFNLLPADEKKGYTLRKGKDPLAIGWLTIMQGYRIIDPEPTDQVLQVEIELDPGRTIKGSLVGPDGKPVTGAVAYGLRYNPIYQASVGGYSLRLGDQTLKTVRFTAISLHPRAPRTVTFVHKAKKLIGHVVLRGNEKEPVTVKLQPWGVLTGRLVDGAGKPLPGIRVKWSYPSFPEPGIRPTESAVTTDKEGRFRLEGLLPGPKFGLTLSQGKPMDANRSAEALKGLILQPGETRDLGDVRVAPAKKGGEKP